MLDDLLPQLPKGGSARITFELPAGWEIFSAESRNTGTEFETKHAARSVFAVGRGWRKRTITSGRSAVDLLIRGEWNFTDEDLAQMAGEVFGEYRKNLGSEPAEKMQIVISRFPSGAAHGTWQAETRGNNVLILSGDMPFKTQSLQRLHEQLRHEIFHLWLPNGVNLTGNYDWFYEGFALYQSLKTGALVGRIRFEDFLDTLSRAYNIDKAQSRRMPLVNASQNRWSGTGTQVYARGMLVAFLADIALLQRSGGKRSVADIFTAVYRAHRAPAAETDGNAAVLAEMLRHPELSTIAQRYINGAQNIDWTAELAAAGLEAAGERFTTLKTREKLNGRHKALLDKLGYNTWRKFAPKI